MAIVFLGVSLQTGALMTDSIEIQNRGWRFDLGAKFGKRNDAWNGGILAGGFQTSINILRLTGRRDGSNR